MRQISEQTYRELMTYLLSRPYKEVAGAIPALAQLPELPEQNETPNPPQETIPPSDEPEG